MSETKCACGQATVKCDFHDKDDPLPCDEILCTGCLDEMSECICNQASEEED